MDATATSPAIETPTNDPRFLRWEGLFPTEAARLREMTPADLLVTADAMRAARDGLQAVYNMPRCGKDASSMIDRELDRFGSILEMAMQELQRRPLDGTSADEDRIRAVATYELEECGADILETLGKLVGLHADHERAAFARRHREAA